MMFLLTLVCILSFLFAFVFFICTLATEETLPLVLTIICFIVFLASYFFSSYLSSDFVGDLWGYTEYFFSNFFTLKETVNSTCDCCCCHCGR